MASFSAKLYYALLPLKEWDVILGQAWLRKYGALIDCKHNTITFTHRGRDTTLRPNTSPPRQPRGQATLVNAQEFEQLLSQGNPLYVAFLRPSNPSSDTTPSLGPTSDTVASISTDPSHPFAKQVESILADYQDVFPDELPPGLPPNRKIDHKIDLEPGHTPPSRPMYRMSPR